MNETLKKGLTITLSVMTAVWSLGVTAFAPVTAGAASAAASEGDLIKASLASVYYYGSDGKRYVFPNQKTYNSWYAGFSDVMTITDSELASISIGGNATYAPGSKMLKITTDPKTYLPGSGGMLYHVTSEAVASGLFGSDWNMDVHDVPDAFFTNYKVSGTAITASEAAVNLPSEFAGLRYWDGSMLYILGMDMEWHKVTDGMMNPQTAYVEAAKFNEYPMGSDWTMAAWMDLYDPARLGSQDGGSNDGPAPEDVSVSVTKKSQELAMKAGATSNAASQNMGVAEIEVCADSASVENVKVDLGAGTAFDTNVFGYFQTQSGAILKESGTEDSDRVQVYQPETNVTVNGCETWYWFNAITTNGGIAKATLKSIEFSGAAGATVIDVNLEMMGRNVVPVASTDLADFIASSPTPTAGTTIQTDGTKQKIYGMQGQVNNNDVYIPNMTFKVTGSLEISNCELRVNGVVVSTSYEWVNGRYIVFTIDEGKRVFDEGTDLWEVWCNVNGEAGQSFTPSWTFPAPYMYIYDNVRAKAAPSPAAAAAPMNATRELIAPNGSQTSNIDGALDLDGASATVTSIPLTKVMEGGVKLDDEVTDDTTNKILGVWVLEVRGDDADLEQLDFVLAGTAADHGVTNCQVRLGMRNDKGEIDVSSVELNNFDLSNFGGEGTVIDTPSRQITTTRRLTVGDWLIVIECDVKESTGTYSANDTVQVVLEDGSGNVTFDIGSTSNTPSADVPATTVTIRDLSLEVNADTTQLYLVANATGKIIGKFALVGSHEDVQVNSVGVTFDAAIAGTTGCTNVTLHDSTGKSLATSQSLTGAGTLTFSVLFTVEKNSQFIIRVVCTQAGSGVTTATVTDATTLASLSLTGLESNQSATVNPAEAGPDVQKEASGSITVSKGNIPADTIIGPGEQKLAFVGTVKASIEESQELETFKASFTEGTANVGVNELDQAMLKLEGFMIDGVAAATETTVCTRDISGTDVECELDGVSLAAGQTGVFRWYVTGESVGSIGGGTASANPTTDSLLIDVTTTTSTATSDVVAKGVDSQNLNAPTAGATLNGRTLVPTAAGVRVVDQSATSRFEQGQLNMVMAELDLIVFGQEITWEGMTMACNGDDTAGVCDDGVDTFDVRLGDNNFVVTGGTIAVGGGMDASAISETIIPGTERITVFLNDDSAGAGRCVDPEGVSFSTSAFGFDVENQSFDPTANAQTAFLPDFTQEAGAVMKHTQITCT